MKRLTPLFGSFYLVFLGWYGARHFGDAWRRDLLVVAVGLYVVLSVFAYFFDRHVRRQLDLADPEELATLRRSDPEFDEFIEDRPRVNERTDWGWRATDLGAGVAMAFYPALAYTLWRYRELRGDTPVDGVAVGLVLIGGLVYLLWRRHRVRTYRCRRCRSATRRLRGEQIRFSCARCGTTWQLGPPVFSDGGAPTPPT